ncbi:MAG TPA: IclR family transcriptional regulator C-terminal domain-containing protein, partial [Caldimonas sp.]
SGLLFLRTFTDAQLDAYFERVSMLPLTFRTLTMPEQVRESVRRVRQEGHAVCDRAFADEFRSVAVPVRDGRGTVVGAMLAVVLAARLSEEELRSTLLPALGAAAQEAGQRWR